MKSKFQSKKESLDLEISREGIKLLNEIKLMENMRISEDEFIKMVLLKLKITKRSVESENNLYYEDVQSGYITRHSEHYFIEPNVVIRDRQLHNMEKVTELFNDKLNSR